MSQVTWQLLSTIVFPAAPFSRPFDVYTHPLSDGFYLLLGREIRWEATGLCTRGQTTLPEGTSNASGIQVTGHKMPVTRIVPGRLDVAALVHDHRATGVEATTGRGVEWRRHIAAEDQTPPLFALFN